MSEVLKPASAGTMESSDVLVELVPAEGREIQLTSVVEAQFRGYDPFRFPEVFDSITREDVVAFIRDNLVAERCAISIIDPVAEEEAE